MTRLNEFLGIFYAALGSFTFGYALSVGSTIIGLQGFIDYYDIDLSGSNPSYADTVQGALNGIFFAGGAFGSVGQGILADKFGRRRALQVACILMIVSAVLMTASVHIGMFLIGQLVQGFCAGMLNTICPVYQSEIAPASHRGALVGMHGFTFVTGQAIVTWVGVGLFQLTNQQLAWRLLCGIQVVPTIALLIGTFFMLESPRWLIANKRYTEAFCALRKLHGKGFSAEEDEQIATTSSNSIRDQLALDQKYRTNILGMFRHKPSRRRLLTGFACTAVNQCTGQTVVWAYMVNLLEGMGIHGTGPLLVLAGFMTLGAICNGLGGFVLDFLGRRKTYMIGLTGVIVTLAVHTAMVAKYSGNDNKSGQATGVAMLFVYVTFFAGCIDVTTYVYVSEIFPTVHRSQGVSYSVGFFFCLCALWTSIAPRVTTRIGWGYYCVFIGLSSVSFTGIYFFFPETAHKTLEEIGTLFGDEVAPTAGDSDGEHHHHVSQEIMCANSARDCPQEKADVAYVERSEA